MSNQTSACPLPKISIVTPSYNQGKFLEQCIRSVLDQGYSRLEYIIMDGGSSDESVAIIQKYQDSLAFWVSQKDAGQSDAINQGFQRSTGDLVAWLNADDFYYPGAFESVAQAYCLNPGASFYFGNGMRANEQGEPLAPFFPEGKILFSQPALIYGLNYILQPAAFINRAALNQVGYLDIHLSYVMDTDLWIRLSQKAAPEPIQAVLAASREYGATKTSTGALRRIEEIRALAERYSGRAMTPGVLCYLLDTVYRMIRSQEDIFPPSYRIEYEALWSATANLMRQFGANPEGIPVGPNETTPTPPQPSPITPEPETGLPARAARRIRRLMSRQKGQDHADRD